MKTDVECLNLSRTILGGLKPLNEILSTLLFVMVASTFLLLASPVRGSVVNNCTETDLRAAMAGGGTVTFACDGTITLANTITNAIDTVLDGGGRQVTISGSNAVRVFYVNTNVIFTLVNVTIAAGLSSNGGGICNAGGTINATNCSFLGNIAQGQSSNANASVLGGAIVNGGQLNLQGCLFSSNRVFGAAGFTSLDPPHFGTAGQDARGGAINNLGSLNADLCVFLQNSASAGAGGLGGSATGYNGNGAPGGSGGTAYGGAICSAGSLAISRSIFTSNAVAGGNGGSGGSGGAILWGGGGGSGGSGGEGGSGNGGAIYNGWRTDLSGSTFVWNTGSGGAGGFGGDGGNATSDIVLPGAGGNGGNSGSGVGGICDGQINLVNCTLAWNSGVGAAGGRGGGSGAPVNPKYPGNNGGAGGNGGNGFGGLSSSSPFNSTNCTIAFNSGSAGARGLGGGGRTPGHDGNDGSAGGGAAGFSGSGGSLINTLLSTNMPGSNCFGILTDLGHNLSSDLSSRFTAPGSLNNTDPKLAPLGNYGGPTLTMALLPGSLAIDAGDTSSAPPTDQRGVPRPVGAAADIGAYEFTAVLSVSQPAADRVDILVNGIAGQWCRLLISSNLLNWTSIATNQIGADGTVLFQDKCDPSGVCRFYRLAIP